MNKNRNLQIDIMKGIAILLMILGHFETIPDVKHWIFSFHMPLFFILAGYFHKPQFNSNTIKKDAKRLVLPYVFVMGILLIYSFSINILYRYTPEVFLLTLGGAIFPNGTHFANSVPVWFLMALFWCRFTFNLCYKLHVDSHGIIAACIGCSLIYLKKFLPFELPFSFIEGVCALPFFTIGYLYKEYGKNINSLWAIPLITIWIVLYRYSSVGMMVAFYTYFPLAFVCACGGTIAIYYCSSIIKKVHLIADFLAWAGINSLVILCAHTIERYIAIPYDRLVEMTNEWTVWGLKILICSIFTLACYKYAWTRYIFNLKGK